VSQTNYLIVKEEAILTLSIVTNKVSGNIVIAVRVELYIYKPEIGKYTIAVSTTLLFLYKKI
jgi:hypothetical protein